MKSSRQVALSLLAPFALAVLGVALLIGFQCWRSTSSYVAFVSKVSYPFRYLTAINTSATHVTATFQRFSPGDEKAVFLLADHSLLGCVITHDQYDALKALPTNAPLSITYRPQPLSNLPLSGKQLMSFEVLK